MRISPFPRPKRTRTPPRALAVGSAAGKGKRASLRIWLAFCILLPTARSAPTESSLGLSFSPRAYQSFTNFPYQDLHRVSDYVSVRDGTKLAADIFRPTANGKPVESPMPAVWVYCRYGRARLQEGRVVTLLDDDSTLKLLVLNGYAVVAVDGRGTGASFGFQDGPFGALEAQDAYDITEWIAAQSWCSGLVGMYGRSYAGTIQYFAAATAPPHLKCIAPDAAIFDLYGSICGGGIIRRDFIEQWSRLVQGLDGSATVAPVDADHTGALLREAHQDHKRNRYAAQIMKPLLFSDDRAPDTHEQIYQTRNPASRIKALVATKIPVYHVTGWYDAWCKDGPLWYSRLTGPRKLLIGPWCHTQRGGVPLFLEYVRWYDYWLKGIDNGIMAEPPIHYFTCGSSTTGQWRASWQWPPPQTKYTTYYFHDGPASATERITPGLLTNQPPSQSETGYNYTVRPDTTSGKASRWSNAYGGRFEYPNMESNDQKSVTYTSQPLNAPLEVTGHPLVEFWISSTAKDVDLFVYLEEVDPAGRSRYLTEGALRASHREKGDPPVDVLGLPQHANTRQSSHELHDQPTELQFDLHPISKQFAAGERIRVTLAGADHDNAESLQGNPATIIRIHHRPDYPSCIKLPVVPSSAPARP